MNHKEIWKDIPGFEYYQVSNFGKVKSLDREIVYSNGRRRFHEGKILKTNFSLKKILKVNLSLNGKGYHLSVHKLVAEAFVPNPNNFSKVLFKNSRKEVITPNNLIFVSDEFFREKRSKQQFKHSTGKNNPKSRKVKIINRYGKEVVYNTFANAEQKYNFPKKLISRISRGERANNIYQGLKIEILDNE